MELRKLVCLAPGGVASDLLEHLQQGGWQVHIAGDVATARRSLRGNGFLVGLLCIERLDDRLGAAIRDLLLGHNDLEWIGLFDAACLDLPACSELILNHLADYHTLPVDADHLLPALGHAYGRARLGARAQAGSTAAGDAQIIGRSAAIRRLLRDIDKVAAVDAPVMISGASGSGKELAAQAIHRKSRRADGPFVAINCSTLPGTLIQSELFGYEKGAFTGASQGRRGFIEAAAGGTIFLDEIGDLPIDLQTNLLRFLQEHTINRVGSTRSLPVDVRVVAASHVDLEQAIGAGRFRADLYYRLNVLPLSVPTLGERREDIALLAEHFFHLHAGERNPRLKGFSPAAMRALESHEWPGNVRELLNRIRRAMVMAEGRLITSADLGLQDAHSAARPLELDEARASAERLAIQQSLQRADNNVSRAARELGVSRMTLYRLLEKHQIES